MLNAPEHACLVIADISGHTSYLAGVELDHPQDILADLIRQAGGAATNLEPNVLDSAGRFLSPAVDLPSAHSS